MKVLKIFGLLTIVASFAACSSNDFEPGTPATEGGERVYFSDPSLINAEVGLTDNTYEIELSREDGTNAITVPVKSTCVGFENLISIPESVTFAEGEKTATLTISISDEMQTFTEYPITLAIDEAYTDPYADTEENGEYPRLAFNLIKNDYKDYAYGTYTSSLWEDSWEVTMQYSEVMDQYRLQDYASIGKSIVFTWNQETGDIKLVDEYIGTGEDWGYGSIVFRIKDDPITFDGDTNTFTFPFDLYEPSDDYSYGSCPEYYKIEELADASSARKMIARRPTLLHKMIRK